MAQIEVRDLTQTTSVLDGDSFAIVSGEGKGTSYYINRSDFIESAPLDNIEITGGSIDGTPIGAIGPETGAFSSLSCTSLSIGGTALTATPSELNTLDGITASVDELNKLDGVTATTDDINIMSGKATLAGLAAALGGHFYPVGSIYCNHSNSANPATLLGFGTWVAIEERTIAGYKSGSTYFGTAGGTGGTTDAIVPTHTHSASSSTNVSISDPGHSHSLSPFSIGSAGTDGNYREVWRSDNGGTKSTTSSGTGISATASTSTTVNSTGVAVAGKNLPPYLTVYMWRRIA